MAGITKALRQVNGAGAPRLIQDTAAVTVEGEVTDRVRDTAPDQGTEAEAEGTIMVLRRITVVSSVVVADIAPNLKSCTCRNRHHRQRRVAWAWELHWLPVCVLTLSRFEECALYLFFVQVARVSLVVYYSAKLLMEVMEGKPISPYA